VARLKLYGAPLSRAFRVMWCLGELGLDYEHVRIGTGGDAMPPGYRAVNPMMKVPAIDDGGFVLTESAAINLYLARKYGAGSLWPESPEDQARAEMWAMWTMTECEPHVLAFAFNTVRLPPEQRNAATAEKAAKALAAPLAVLEVQLKANGNVLGATFTIADLIVASVLYVASRAPFDWSAVPTAKAWLDRTLARPAASAAIKQREG
jgi:glutathione S-transferase